MKTSNEPGATELAMKGFVIALQGYPEWAIAEAVRAFLRGAVPGASKSFCPKPPELSEAVRGRLKHVYDEIEQRASQRERDRQLRDQIADRHSDIDPTVRIRMGFKMSVLSAGLARAGGTDMVAEANNRGLDDLMALAQQWGVPVPEELFGRIAP